MTGSISMRLQAIVKPKEKQYKVEELHKYEGLKPRNIFNPTDQVKAVLGYVSSQALRIMKRTKTFGPHMIQGMNTGQLEERILTAYRTVQNPGCVMWDGGRHDAHQHADFIEKVDSYFFKNVLHRLNADLGFHRLESLEILKKTTMAKCPITLFMNNRNVGVKTFGNHRIEACSTVLNGTVFSGHPTRTTFGNTFRVLVLIKEIARIAGLEWKTDIYPY